MPSKNTIREYCSPAYYHVYNRGAGGQKIFRDAQDKRKFIRLLERYLVDDEKYAAYPTYGLEVLAYCVMGNHFHLLVYQDVDMRAVTEFMRSVSTAYSMYYNLKYKNKGHVFQGVFRASRITNDSYLQHISRYIHLNPRTYLTYRWSSLAYYLGKPAPDWLNTHRVCPMSAEDYRVFLGDYESRHALLELIKQELAL